MNRKILVIILSFALIFTVSGCGKKDKESDQQDDPKKVETTEASSVEDKEIDSNIQSAIESLKTSGSVNDVEFDAYHADQLIQYLEANQDKAYSQISAEFERTVKIVKALAEMDIHVRVDSLTYYQTPQTQKFSVEFVQEDGTTMTWFDAFEVIDDDTLAWSEEFIIVQDVYSEDNYVKYVGNSGEETMAESDFIEDYLRLDAYYANSEYLMAFSEDSTSDNQLKGYIGPYLAGGFDFEWTGGAKTGSDGTTTEFNMSTTGQPNVMKMHRFGFTMDGTDMYYLVAPNISYERNPITVEPTKEKSGSDAYFYDLSAYADGLIEYVHEVKDVKKDSVFYELIAVKSIDGATISFYAIDKTGETACTVNIEFLTNGVAVTVGE